MTPALQSYSKTEVALIIFFLCPVALWLVQNVQVDLGSTLCVFIFVTIIGLWSCHRTIFLLNDSKLGMLGSVWLIKLGLTVFLLYAGWITDLDPSSPNWGSDPFRFYYDAWATVQNNWIPLSTWDGYTFASGVNYTGIIYYYGFIFYLFGHNPVTPALVNSFITLLGTLFLVRCLYAFFPHRTDKDWYLVWLLLIPEVVWYDIQTSRESLMSVLIIVSVLSAGRYFVGVKNIKILGTLLLSGTTLFAVLAVRTSMAIPIIMSMFFFVVLFRSQTMKGPLATVLVLGLVLGLMFFGPLIQNQLGGADVNYSNSLVASQSFENNVASSSQMSWSDNSIGMLIVPRNAWQSILFLWPRMILYLSVPFPQVTVTLGGLLEGTYPPWANLMNLLTAILMVSGFPYVLAATAMTFRNRKSFPAELIIPITFWITFIAVAGGNMIIHERYRLMCSLLLFACMWIGYAYCSSSELNRWASRWFTLLAICAAFFIGYKYIL